MSFFKWVRKKEEEPDENEPVLAAVIKKSRNLEIFQDILKENGIPFICPSGRRRRLCQAAFGRGSCAR